MATKGNALLDSVTGAVPVAQGGTASGTTAGAATSLGLGTGDSPEFTAVNIGHASDTTLTRTGAGDIAIEGKGVYRADGTDVAVADGGTGGGTASITLFNNITGYTASGATGTTSTNLVFSTSPVLVTPALGTPSSGDISSCTGSPTFTTLGVTTINF